MLVTVYVNGRFYNEREFGSVREASAFVSRQINRGRTVEMTPW